MGEWWGVIGHWWDIGGTMVGHWWDTWEMGGTRVGHGGGRWVVVQGAKHCDVGLDVVWEAGRRWDTGGTWVG